MKDLNIGGKTAFFRIIFLMSAFLTTAGLFAETEEQKIIRIGTECLQSKKITVEQFGQLLANFGKIRQSNEVVGTVLFDCFCTAIGMNWVMEDQVEDMLLGPGREGFILGCRGNGTPIFERLPGKIRDRQITEDDCYFMVVRFFSIWPQVVIPPQFSRDNDPNVEQAAEALSEGFRKVWRDNPPKSRPVAIPHSRSLTPPAPGSRESLGSCGPTRLSVGSAPAHASGLGLLAAEKRAGLRSGQLTSPSASAVNTPGNSDSEPDCLNVGCVEITNPPPVKGSARPGSRRTAASSFKKKGAAIGGASRASLQGTVS